MAGRHRDGSGFPLGFLPNRLWNWFETLPFYRGMAYIAGIALVPIVVLGWFLSDGGGDASKKRAEPAAPSNPAQTAEPTPTWMEYVPPRQSGPRRVLVRPGSTPTPTPVKTSPGTTASPKITQVKSPRPRPSRTVYHDEDD